MGVELGQIAWLLIIFPFLQLVKGNYYEWLNIWITDIFKNFFSGKYFNTISKISNWLLIIAGIYLLSLQLNGYFTDHHHHEDKPNQNHKNINDEDKHLDKDNHNDNHHHNEKHEDGHHHDGHYHSH